MSFHDRSHAGRLLGKALQALDLVEPVVLALPRGGVPVAYEVAKTLHAPLDLLLVRKIGVPGQPELAAAAVVDGHSPQVVLNNEVVTAAGIDLATLQQLVDKELAEIERRRKAYLGSRKVIAVGGRDAIVVDDGIATGASVKAALKALRQRHPRRLVLAVPVAPADAIRELTPFVDHVVCLSMPEPFYAIGLHYDDFHQLTDGEVVALLESFESVE
jgi:putative phosphoribosyl transferase